MAKARLRLTGIISFSARLYAQIIGLIFSIIVARRLDPETFGLWAYIGTLISYSLVPVNLWSIWIGRDAARGRKVMVPTLAIGSFTIPIASTIYIISSLLSISRIGFRFEVLILGLIVLIPNSFVNLYLAITSGYAPQYIGIGMIMFETAKLTSVLILIVGFNNSSINSVLLSVALAHAVYLITLLYGVRDTFGNDNISEYVRKWSRGLTVSALSTGIIQLFSLDIILISLLSGGTLITAYWQAITIISLIVLMSAELIGGLYPRLIAGGGEEDVIKSFHFTMTLAIPILFGSVILSDYFLSVLNPTYASVWLGASILCVSNFIRILSNFYRILVIGPEKFDEKGIPTIKEYIKSKIAVTTYVYALTSPIYLAFITFILIFFKASLEMLIALMATTKLIVIALQAIIYYFFVRKYTTFRLHHKELVPYLISALIMSLIVVLFRAMIFGSPEIQIWATLNELGIMISAGALIYFVTLYLINNKFRELLHEIWIFLINFKKNKI